MTTGILRLLIIDHHNSSCQAGSEDRLEREELLDESYGPKFHFAGLEFLRLIICTTLIITSTLRRRHFEDL